MSGIRLHKASDWQDMIPDLDLYATEYDDITGVELDHKKYEFQLRVYEGDITTDNTPDEKISIDYTPSKI